MKKILAILLIFLTGCTIKLNTYQEIKYNTLKDMLTNKETFVLYIGAADCSHCKIFKPTLEKLISNYQVTVYYLDVNDFTDEEIDELSTLTRFPKSTPTVLFIKDGITDWQSGYNMINGSKDYDFVVDKFRLNGYVE